MELAELVKPMAAAQQRTTAGISDQASGRKETAANEPIVADQLPALLTFAQAARMLGISLRQFRRLVDAGKVAFVRVSERSPRVRPSELERYLEGSTVRYSEPS